MSGVQSLAVGTDEGELRLDRWFRQRFPGLTHGRLEKLLRTGQIRVDGKRAKAAQRLEAGQTIRIPPLDDTATETPTPRAPLPLKPEKAQGLAAELKRAILFMDDDIIALNKPAGLAVQGGGKVKAHVDGLLDHLQFDAKERPRLVHRLDQETSGVLLIGRTAKATRRLTEAFRERATRKEYWAVTVGVPQPRQGRIDLPLARSPSNVGRVVEEDDEEGQRAVTDFAVVEAAAQHAAFVAMWPVTGRTHQLRLHMAALDTPILGDGKYGGARSEITGAELPRQLHLHARRLVLPHPTRGTIDVTAPLSPHMVSTFRYFDFDAKTKPEGPED
ncbi:23S rRNA pseudouridine955/2504/2580 synthase [Inquilinus ginsengisoli]|uniref:Pseudouridine synthase n=1 Tax=Inquilinus ginsengisoli TaxID=363840 RepID=A0ABU1JIB5_9PROT|nr:RluA family pseudouridine synthase [Inquilinus ginsengisoli]MDR6287789.1 23S rRNA pseudouridine955/2504/2580 synthase [Inquilinus ginsengisoli]